jgi:hypothetical protein
MFKKNSGQVLTNDSPKDDSDSPASMKTVNIRSITRSQVFQGQTISVFWFSALHTVLSLLADRGGAVNMARLRLVFLSVLDSLSPSAAGHSFPLVLSFNLRYVLA